MNLKILQRVPIIMGGMKNASLRTDSHEFYVDAINLKSKNDANKKNNVSLNKSKKNELWKFRNVFFFSFFFVFFSFFLFFFRFTFSFFFFFSVFQKLSIFVNDKFFKIEPPNKCKTFQKELWKWKKTKKNSSEIF